MISRRIFPASGGGLNVKRAQKAIRLVRYGCANRPFYHIVVTMKGKSQFNQPIEQLGTLDPMLNDRNEKLVSFNYERVGYWLGEGAVLSVPVAELLGLSGFLPMHPRTYMTAWRNRKKVAEESNTDNTTSEKSN